MIATTDLSTVLAELSADVRDLSIGHGRSTIETVQGGTGSPEAASFYREYVAQNKPCLIKGGCANWAAVGVWNLSYLSTKLGSAQITVDYTPNGYGDAIAFNPTTQRDTFVLPEERRMTMSDFQSELMRSWHDVASVGVPYVQHQNDSLRSEFANLIGDREIEPEIAWASEALDQKPEAVNLWIGDQRAVTSFHKDHYENFYAVIAGCKEFLLLPPADCHRMYLREYPVGRYRSRTIDDETSRFEIQVTQNKDEDEETVVWSAVDPLSEDCASTCPRFFQGPEPIRASVEAGDILYLPSMYYHHVSQSGDAYTPTIAVNYWYNMAFDVKYAYFSLVEKLTTRAQLSAT